MEKVNICGLNLSRLILGTNPISGFSHQSSEMDSVMKHYFTMMQVKRLFKEAEKLGITAVIGRVDHYILRVLMEHWDDGGKLNWLAQTCPELGSIERGIEYAVEGGASACFIHGGIMDFMLAQNRLDEIPPLINKIRSAGLPAGIAGHNPDVFRWAESELDVDFYMCCYYNPTSRANDPAHKPGLSEWFYDKDRQIMADLITTLKRPAIHYKIMAAGRNDPAEAFAFTKKYLRPSDAICVGVYDENNPDILRRNVELIES